MCGQRRLALWQRHGPRRRGKHTGQLARGSGEGAGGLHEVTRHAAHRMRLSAAAVRQPERRGAGNWCCCGGSSHTAQQPHSPLEAATAPSAPAIVSARQPQRSKGAASHHSTTRPHCCHSPSLPPPLPLASTAQQPHAPLPCVNSRRPAPPRAGPACPPRAGRPRGRTRPRAQTPPPPPPPAPSPAGTRASCPSSCP